MSPPPQDAPPGPRGLSAKADVGDNGVPAPLPKLRSGAPADETARDAAGVRPAAGHAATAPVTTPKTPRSATPATGNTVDEGDAAGAGKPSAKAKGRRASGSAAKGRKSSGSPASGTAAGGSAAKGRDGEKADNAKNAGEPEDTDEAENGDDAENTDKAENSEAGDGEKDGKGKGRWPRLRGRRTAVIR